MNSFSIPNSLMMQRRASCCIPGMTQLLSKRPDQFSEGIWPSYFSKAKGCEIWDLDGNRYLDMSIGGIGATVLGYADADVSTAVKEAIENGSSCSLNCPEEVELAELLCQIHPWSQKVRFARTGGESMAIAVRICRAYTRRDKIAFCGYHGWHDWYLAANLKNKNALHGHLLDGLSPLGVPHGLAETVFPFRYNHIEELEEIIANHGQDLAAVITEPIRNEYPQNNFLEQIRTIANKTGAVFVIDEISAGFRMNSAGAHIKLGIEPDIAVFAKAIGNGFPISAVIGKTAIMDAAQNTFISSTNWTERIGPVAALATIQKHCKLDVGKHLTHIGQKVQDGWIQLAQKHGLKIKVSGIASLSHFSFLVDKPMVYKAIFIQLMLERGILASNIFYPMYTHTDEHVKTYHESLNSVFAEIVQLKKRGRLEKSLKGKPSVLGFKRLT